jgi:hypothetical protein
MKKNFVALLVLVSLLIVPHTISVKAATTDTPTPIPGIVGYAECDMCGYCPKNYATPPGNWTDCVRCLYPSIYPTIKADPTAKDTFLVDQKTQNAPTPFQGHMYTMLGCIQTNLSSFTNDGAAVSVVQFFLDFIFRIVGGIALIYFMYGAYLLMTSQGSAERLNKGRQTLYGAIIGLVFVLLSVFLIRLIASGILKIPGLS